MIHKKFLMICLVFLFSINCTISEDIHGIEYNNVGEYDCCPLIWKPLTVLPSGSFVPSDAVLAGYDGDKGTKQYFTMLPSQNVFSHDLLGYVKEDSLNRPHFRFEYLGKERYYEYHPEEKCLFVPQSFPSPPFPPGKCELFNISGPAVVLTNPYNCQLGWWQRNTTKGMPLHSLQYHYPRLGKVNLGRYLCTKFNDVMPGYFNISTLQFHTIDGYCDEPHENHGPEFLYIDCHASVQNMFKAELFDLKSDLDKFMKEGGKEEVSLQSTTIINESNETQETDVNLKAETTKSFRLTEESGSNETRITKIHYSVDAGIEIKAEGVIGKIFGYSGSAHTNYKYDKDTEERFEKYVRTGRMDTQTSANTYTFNQKILEPAHSNTTISIMTTPIHGNITFKAGYRIKTPKLLDFPGMSYDFVFFALKRLEVGQGMQNITRQGDYLVWYKEGTLTIQSGTNTHVSIISSEYSPPKKQIEAILKNETSAPIIQSYKLYPFGEGV